jgi:Gram-negative bacterial TonB protein C-terminal
MPKTIHLLAAIAVLFSGTPAFPAKKEPLRLAKSSSWNVDYADDRCRLARGFGTGDQEVIILLDRFGPGDHFRLTVTGKPVTTTRPNGDVVLQFGPAEQEQTVPFLSGNIGKGTPALIIAGSLRISAPTAEELKAREDKDYSPDIQLSAVDGAKAAAVRYLQIGKPFRQTIILETGSMRAAFAALDKCVDELQTHWGIDVEKHKTLKRYATPAQSPGNWIISGDYPIKMLMEGQPSIVEFRLSVGEDGKPTACHIQLTTRPKEFDDAVCKSLMRRAKFEPALDAEGKPLASFYRNTVRFQIP